MSIDISPSSLTVPPSPSKSAARLLFKQCRTGTASSLSAALTSLSDGPSSPSLATLLSTLRTSCDETALHVVVSSHSSPLPLAALLLSVGHPPSVRGHGRHLRAPLHEAARRTDRFGPPCVQLLLAHGAPVDAVKSGDWTPLMLAAAAAVPDSVRHLLDDGASTSLANKDGATAAHLAAKAASVEALKLLLDKDQEAVNARTRNRRTPLHYAARAGAVDCVTLLLRRGADVRATEKSGMCPGHEAAAGSEARVLQLLMEAPGGDDAVWKGDVGGLTVLHHAAVSGGEEVARVAVRLAGEKDVDMEDARGQTAMFLAIWHGRNGVIDVLRGKGARVRSEWTERFRKAGREQSAKLVGRLLNDGG